MRIKITAAGVFGLMLVAVALCCGPDLSSAFISSIRDILTAPESSLLATLKQVRKEPPSPHGVKPVQNWMDVLPTTLEVDVADLRHALEAQAVSKQELEAIVGDYKKLRQGQLWYWSDDEGYVLPRDDRRQAADDDSKAPTHPWIAEQKWPAAIPAEFRLYAEGVVHWHEKPGGVAKACTKWEELLALPLENRRARSAWAAWMLALSATNYDEARRWYRKVLVCVNEEGCSDSLRMAPAAAYHQKNTPLEDLCAAYHNVKANRRKRYQDNLCESAGRVLADHSQAIEAARDPAMREIMSVAVTDKDLEDWVGILKEAEIKDDIAMAHIGLSAYSSGHYDVAVKALAIAQVTWETLWIRSKLALQRGEKNEAARLMAAAVRLVPSDVRANVRSITEEMPNPYDLEALYNVPHPDQEIAGIETGLRHSRFFADGGALMLAHSDFASALKLFMDAKCPHDAAYVAEHLMTADELISFVRKQHLKFIPETLPTDEEALEINWHHWHDNRTDDTQNRILYVIARRLAREFHFNDAREFYPPAMRPFFDRYVALYRRGCSKVGPVEIRAKCLMEAARWHRWMGLELFGAEGEPDAAMWDGDYPPNALSLIRRTNYRGLEGEREWATSGESWKETVPTNALPLRPSTLEMTRLKKNILWGRPRFHYREVAVKMARDAAHMLPTNSEEAAMMLAEGGCWMTPNENGIDLMFEELISRFSKTKFAQEADKCRWYPADFKEKITAWDPTKAVLEPMPGDVAKNL